MYNVNVSLKLTCLVMMTTQNTFYDMTMIIRNPKIKRDSIDRRR